LVIAHGFHGLAAAALGEWRWEPVTLALLAVSAIAYWRGIGILWRRAGIGNGIARWQAAAFAAGLVSISVALQSPLAWLSDVLFSAHMTQHEILMVVSAPLLVFGHPLQAFLWALSPSRRDAVGRWTRRPTVDRTWSFLTAPAPVFMIHALALWIWHMPALFEGALADSFVHGLQHASFLLAAALFWWGMIHGRYGRIGYGVGVLYVFLTAVHSSILGALMTVAPRVWYPFYATRSAEWNVDALQDQQVAGLLMWIPSGVIFIVFGLALLAAWIGESERRARLGSVVHASRLSTKINRRKERTGGYRLL
jgi:cytochrome c oxidase assembly factor CtaG